MMRRLLRPLPLALALLFLAGAGWALVGGEGTPLAIFEVSVKGKSWDTGALVPPGFKLGLGKVNDKLIVDVLTGVNTGDYSVDYIDQDAGGKLYLYYYARDEMGYATNPDGVDVTLMRGQCASDGNLWMYGFYQGGFATAFSNADCMLTGKFKWQKSDDPDVYIPTKFKGTLSFVSEDITTGMTLKVKSKTLLPM